MLASSLMKYKANEMIKTTYFFGVIGPLQESFTIAHENLFCCYRIHNHHQRGRSTPKSKYITTFFLSCYDVNTYVRLWEEGNPEMVYVLDGEYYEYKPLIYKRESLCRHYKGTETYYPRKMYKGS